MRQGSLTLDTSTMTDTSAFSILIAEDNDVSRELMLNVLKTRGHTVIGARSGEEALNLVSGQKFDLIFIDINMEPMGGFEFARHLRHGGISVPIIAITGEDPAGLEIRASELGIQTILEKPVLPERLIHIAQHTCKLTRQSSAQQLAAMNAPGADPKDLMLRAIEIAVKTASSGKGRAFGAILTDSEGRVIAKGSNEFADEHDPLSFAEAIAIRKAAQHLGRQDLSDCTLYCSFKPTRFGQALIDHVHIPRVFYALAYEDILSPEERAKSQDEAARKAQYPEPDYLQICLEEARRAFSIKG